ncbi:hypothetical protein [Aquimarina sp. AU474]|uniref:hypothetical protein n=1 Tax=Aquimarina sp. AU474 TaxID=2108529 RepID=UPI000D69D2FC|nr:hypothetical protein [Aquimarina sp. AU474]
MRKIILAFLIVSSFQTFGQTKTLKGKILAKSLEDYAINIVNFTNKTGTTNDQNGVFEIPANVGDSITFSSVQYDIISIVVTPNHFEEEGVKIILRPKIQLLDQVKVSNIKLSGNLDDDVGKVELKPFVDNKTLGLPFTDKPQPTQIERRIYTARSGILDLPINYLNGKLKRLKRIKALTDLQYLVERAEITFDTSFFVNDLDLSQDLITDFMYYCAEDQYFKNLLENSKKLTLLEFFKKKVISYKKLKEID